MKSNPQYYILRDGIPVKVTYEEHLLWGNVLKDAGENNKIEGGFVGKTEVNDIILETQFLGLDLLDLAVNLALSNQKFDSMPEIFNSLHNNQPILFLTTVYQLVQVYEKKMKKVAAYIPHSYTLEEAKDKHLQLVIYYTNNS
jgi:hypothetical protein